jgi:hypothetical protein
MDMTNLSAELKAPSARQIASAAQPISDAVLFILLAGAAFGLYWASSFLLEARNATTHFGADTWYFAELAQGNVFSRIASNYFLDRVARFHPTTVVMAAAWMQILSPLTQWIAPLSLLKAMFAAVGAAGVWAATSAFAAVVSRGYALLLGIIYAVSFGVWYFASIEESKIVTASLSALYIAIYLQVRKTWTIRGAILLTVILLLACLNEMVSGFLVVIPAVDALMRYGWDWRRVRWIALHALAGPVAFVIIEGVIYGRLVAVSHPEGASHFSMLFFYISKNEYSLSQLYSFVINWLFFNIAAPTPDASYAVPAGANYKGYLYKGYFEPALLNYFFSSASAGVAALFGAMFAGTVWLRDRAEGSAKSAGILLGLGAYTLLRAVFFFIFNPYEPLLFSPAVTLAHMLMIVIPLAGSRLPARHILLGGFAALLLITNGAFIIGR